MADQTKTIKVDVKNNFQKTAEDGKKMNKVVFDTKSAINDVLKSGDAYEKQLKDVNKIVKETPLNVRDMNKQIQAYQSIALSAGRETPVGKQALKQAADLRDRYIDIQNETKRLADDQKNLQGVMQLASTGVAGFGAVQSSMALMGGESEQLRETMVKLMAAQTLLNSINQIATALEKESSAMLLLKSIRTKVLTSSTYAYATAQGVATKGAKLLRLALISTGVGALVVGVGLLIANFSKVKKAVSNAIKKFKFLKLALWPLILTIEVVKKGLKALGIGQGKNAEQEKADAKRREDEAKADEDRWNAKKDRLNKEFDLKQKLAKKEIDLAKAKGEETAEAERKLITDAIANAEKKAKEDKSKFDEEAKGQIKYLEDRVANEKAALEVLQKIREEGIRRKTDLSNEEQKILEAANEDIYSHTVDIERKLEESNEELNDYRIKQNAKWIKTTKGDVESLQKDLEIFDAGEVKSTEDKLKAKRDKWKAYAKFRLDTARKIEDLENSLLEDGIDKELEISADRNRRLIEDTKKNSKLKGEEKAKLVALYEDKAEAEAEDIRNKYRLKDLAEERKHQANKEKQENDYLDQIAKLQEANFEATLSDEDLEIRRVEEKYFTLLEMAKGNADDLNEVEIARLNALNEVYIKHDDIRIASEKKSNDDAVALKQTELNAKFALITGSLDAINELVGAFTAKDEKNAKKQFKIQKALSLASAVTNTAQAVTSALATANPIPGGRFIEAGIAGTMGLANIVKIGSTSFESPSPSGGGASGGGPQAPISSGGSPANFNIVGENNINQLAELQGQPTKAYVVSDDVTSAQAMDRKISDFATL